MITAILAGFMDSITVLIFFTILTINLCKMFDISPVPLVIAEVCTANIGGSGTLVGDPPNVIIGSVLNYTFSDFVKNTGPIAIVATIVVTLFFFLINLKGLKSIKKLNDNEKEKLIIENKISNMKYVKIGGSSFVFAILFLVTHHLLNEMFGFHIYASIATLLPAMVCLSLLKEESDDILRSIDGETLLFFIGLFIIIGSLEKTGVISVIAEKIIRISKGNPILLSFSFIWICGVISAIVDNVPMALTMSYILLSIISQTPELAMYKSNFVWSLTLGLDIGGNMTPIGASANVMAYSILEKIKYT
ncbi:sodium:proton antiporter [Caloramator sp. mosi_1]|uniref:SLC13 family permease n=1 Tax=Caloramator sp. mosi_1 TaxID=3023090 RepID=UPI0023629A26|nr:SLC13 family permease [Caloramator sp. mosi_1]WDC83210.1 sodium:proton antiporter [Caloramator sp. mosi_1]